MAYTKQDCIDALQDVYQRNDRRPLTREIYNDLRGDGQPAASTIRNHFGNRWIDAAEHAEVEIRGRGGRPDPVKRERQRRKKVIYIELKRRGSCMWCDESRPNALCYHHDVPGNKSFSVSQSLHTGVGLEEYVDEINKCSLLCANCHQVEHSDWPPNF